MNQIALAQFSPKFALLAVPEDIYPEFVGLLAARLNPNPDSPLSPPTPAPTPTPSADALINGFSRDECLKICVAARQTNRAAATIFALCCASVGKRFGFLDICATSGLSKDVAMTQLGTFTRLIRKMCGDDPKRWWPLNYIPVEGKSFYSATQALADIWNETEENAA